MPSIIQILRSTIAGKRPAPDVTKAGMIYVNYADNQIGVMDTSGTARDMLAIRLHNIEAKYIANDPVYQNGFIWKAKTAVGPKAWNDADWVNLSGWGM